MAEAEIEGASVEHVPSWAFLQGEKLAAGILDERRKGTVLKSAVAHADEDVAAVVAPGGS